MRKVVIASALGAGFLLGDACSWQTLAGPARLPAGVPVVRQSRWQVLATSVEGRPIEAAQFGRGRRQILIVGPLAGDQMAALGLVDELANYLNASGERMGDLTVTVVRDPNPDGRVRRTRPNAHQVDLDRNFAASNWQKLPAGNRQFAGIRPHSEPESRVLASLISDLKPVLLVMVAAQPQAASLGVTGPAEALARGLTEALNVAATNVEPSSGSLAAYAGGDRGIPTLSLAIPAARGTAENWLTYGPALAQAMGVTPPEPRPLPAHDPTLEPMPVAPLISKRVGIPQDRPGVLPPHPIARLRRARPLPDVADVTGAQPTPPSPASPTPASQSPTASDDRYTWRHAVPTQSAPSAEFAATPSKVTGTPPGQPVTEPIAPEPASSPRPPAFTSSPPAHIFWPATRIERLPPVDQESPPGRLADP